MIRHEFTCIILSQQMCNNSCMLPIQLVQLCGPGVGHVGHVIVSARKVIYCKYECFHSSMTTMLQFGMTSGTASVPFATSLFLLWPWIVSQ